MILNIVYKNHQKSIPHIQRLKKLILKYNHRKMFRISLYAAYSFGKAGSSNVLLQMLYLFSVM